MTLQGSFFLALRFLSPRKIIWNGYGRAPCTFPKTLSRALSRAVHFLKNWSRAARINDERSFYDAKNCLFTSFREQCYRSGSPFTTRYITIILFFENKAIWQKSIYELFMFQYKISYFNMLFFTVNWLHWLKKIRQVFNFAFIRWCENFKKISWFL